MRVRRETTSGVEGPCRTIARPIDALITRMSQSVGTGLPPAWDV